MTVLRVFIGVTLAVAVLGSKEAPCSAARKADQCVAPCMFLESVSACYKPQCSLMRSQQQCDADTSCAWVTRGKESRCFDYNLAMSGFECTVFSTRSSCGDVPGCKWSGEQCASVTTTASSESESVVMRGEDGSHQHHHHHHHNSGSGSHSWSHGSSHHHGSDSSHHGSDSSHHGSDSSHHGSDSSRNHDSSDSWHHHSGSWSRGSGSNSWHHHSDSWSHGSSDSWHHHSGSWSRGSGSNSWHHHSDSWSHGSSGSDSWHHHHSHHHHHHPHPPFEGDVEVKFFASETLIAAFIAAVAASFFVVAIRRSQVPVKEAAPLVPPPQ